jgi:hypothetical protein
MSCRHHIIISTPSTPQHPDHNLCQWLLPIVVLTFYWL